MLITSKYFFVVRKSNFCPTSSKEQKLLSQYRHHLEDLFRSYYVRKLLLPKSRFYKPWFVFNSYLIFFHVAILGGTDFRPNRDFQNYPKFRPNRDFQNYSKFRPNRDFPNDRTSDEIQIFRKTLNFDRTEIFKKLSHYRHHLEDLFRSNYVRKVLYPNSRFYKPSFLF